MELAFDFETELIKDYGTDKVKTDHKYPLPVCVSYAHPTEGSGVVTSDAAFLEVLQDIPWEVVIAHKCDFDIGVCQHWPRSYKVLLRALHERRVRDTIVMWYNRNPDPAFRKSSLAYVYSTLFPTREPLNKGDVRLGFQVGRPLTRQEIDYAIQDSVATLDIYRKLKGIDYGGLQEITGAQWYINCVPSGDPESPDSRYSTAAGYMHQTLQVGLAIHQDNLHRTHDELEMEYDRYGIALVEQGLARLKRPSTAAVETLGPVGKEILTKWHPSGEGRVMQRRRKDHLQVSTGNVVKSTEVLKSSFEAFAKTIDLPTKETATGALSLARDDWKDSYSLLPEGLRLFLDYQKVEKYLTAFTRPLITAKAERVHPDYYIPGTRTHRWACRKPNVQQAPRRLKDLYCARPGSRLVYADYPTLELYTLAQAMYNLGIEGPLLTALRAGDDVHMRTAALMFDKDIADITKDERQAAKACNFGLPGGLGEAVFMSYAWGLGLKWTKEDTKKIKRRWFEIFTDVADYKALFNIDYFEFKPKHLSFSEWRNELGFKDGERLTNFDLGRMLNEGRHYTVTLPSGRKVGNRYFSRAMNFFFQGLGADVITEAYNMCMSYGLTVCAVVHDSIMLEEPQDAAGDRAPLMAMCMAGALRKVCPIVPSIQGKIETKILTTWKEE